LAWGSATVRPQAPRRDSTGPCARRPNRKGPRLQTAGKPTQHGADSPHRRPRRRGTEPYKINDRGQVVGSYNPQGPSAGAPGSKGFLLDRGRFITIQGPGAAYTQAEGVNDAGVVVLVVTGPSP
jgi:hypothetical protein